MRKSRLFDSQKREDMLGRRPVKAKRITQWPLVLATTLICIYCILSIIHPQFLDRAVWGLQRPRNQKCLDPEVLRILKSATTSPIPQMPTNASDANIVLITATSGNKGFMSIPGIKEQVYINRESYAARHGYAHMWANMSSYKIQLPEDPSYDVPLYWSKIPVLQEAFRRYKNAEWIWWLDLDIILMNHTLSMWDRILSPSAMQEWAQYNHTVSTVGGQSTGYVMPLKFNPADTNMVIATDNWGLNVGSFLLRRSLWTDSLLGTWANPLYIEKKWTFPEQEAFLNMYEYNSIISRHTLVTQQKSLNAYGDYNLLGEHWQSGDLLVHFAGCGENESCKDRWSSYWVQIEDQVIPQFVREKLLSGQAGIENVQKGVAVAQSQDMDYYRVHESRALD